MADRVSLRTYARMRGKYSAWPYRLRDRGIIVPDEDGKIDPDVADAQVIAHLGDKAGIEPPKKTNGKKRVYPKGALGKTGRPKLGAPESDYSKHRAERERLNVEKLRRELEQQKGDTLSRAEVCREWSAAGALVRDGLLSFPDRLTVELANSLGVDARAETREIVEREVRALLHSMADKLESLDEKETDNA